MRDLFDSKYLHYTALRVAIGIVFLVAGGSKTVALLSGNTGVQDWVIGLMADTWVPTWAAALGGYAMPFVELALGITLFFGIMSYAAATGGILMFATFLFVAEFNHAEPGMILDIVQQVVFTISLFLLAQFHPGKDEALALYNKRA